MAGTNGSEQVGVVHAAPATDPHSTLLDLAGRAAGQSGAENFPVALRVLPRLAQDRLRRVYTYARFVDDVGDEAVGDRTLLLDRVADDVARLSAGGGAELTPVAGMRPVLEECGAPVQLLIDLIEANRVDQHVTTYETFDDLLGYCRLSAAPVGRLVLYVAGAATEQNVGDSDAVCAALQVLEHCQDVGEDARSGRTYLPAHDLRAAGVTPADLTAAATTTALRRADHDVLSHPVRPSKAGTAARALLVAAHR